MKAITIRKILEVRFEYYLYIHRIFLILLKIFDRKINRWKSVYFDDRTKEM